MGYHQLPLSEDSSKITATIGIHRFLARPLSISTSPGEYHARIAHDFLQVFYLNGAIVYTDGIVIYGRDVKVSWISWIGSYLR